MIWASCGQSLIRSFVAFVCEAQKGGLILLFYNIFREVMGNEQALGQRVYTGF